MHLARASLSGRLALLFALLVLLAFSLAGWAMFERLAAEISHERAHVQRAKLEVALTMLHRVRAGGRVSDHWPRVLQEIDALQRTDRSTRYWVFCSEGPGPGCHADRPALSGLPGSPNWQRLPFADAGLQPLSANSGDTLWALRADLPGLPPGHRVRLVATRDDAAGRLALRRFAWEVAAISLLAAVVTAALGWALTRRTLRPVRELSASAAALRPDQLSRRIDTPPPGSELHGLALAFNAALGRIEQAFSQLETFNAHVAHELRTPLNTLIGATQVALSRPRSNTELRDVLTTNLEDCERLATLVRDMLFLARADHGQRADSLRPTDLLALAQDTAEFFEPLLDEHHLTLTVSGQARATVDAGLVKRALSNLVANAVQYGQADGPITIAVIDRPGQGAGLVVGNSGPALSADILDHMFDRFYRGDSARHSAGGHAGLGLAIVKAVAVMHGGTVFAHCADGRVQVGMWLP
ncbi:MAG: heavy metal sensor histidine kinase [Aquabacterium sp.]|nr:heavy metal sensor histidine kinase [Aquabacterium sp.]